MNVERYVLCVLAMPHAGSAAVARLLHEAGVGFGGVPGGLDDDAWSHPIFRAIDDELLERLGMANDDPSALPAGWASARGLDDLRARASAAIAGFAADARWGWLSTRAWLTLPFWRQMLPRARYLVCVPEPVSYISALDRRLGLSAEAAADLWLTYVSTVLSATSSDDRLIVFPDELTSNPEAEGDRVLAFLRSSSPAAAVPVQALPAPHLTTAEAETTFAGTTYALLRRAASVDSGLSRELAALSSAVASEATRLVRRARSAEHEAMSARDRLGELERQVERHAAVIEEREEGIAWLRDELAEAQRMRERLEDVNRSLGAQLDTILASRGWRWLNRARRLKARLQRLSGLGGRTPGPTSRAREETGAAAPRTSRPAAPGSWESLELLPEIARGGVRRNRMALAPRQRHDVVCLSIIDWDFRFQRPQQLMAAFAQRGHRVFYVSLARFADSGEGLEPKVRLIRDGVYEVQLAVPRPPDLYGGGLPADVLDAATDSLARLRHQYDISCAALYVMIASWAPLATAARRLWAWPVVYDCMDEWENFPGVKRAVVDAEAALVRECDLLVVTAARLQQKWAFADRPTVLARNAVDFDFYAERCIPNTLLAGVPHPIVGYYGAIADWFDVDLVVEAARARPGCQFVLLGGVFGVDVSTLTALPNVRLLGQQPYDTMPQYLFHFDACLIPFKINPITQATDPVKLYEYLSAGKPVVSVALAELAPCADLVHLARTPGEFVAAIDRALSEDDPDLVERRRAFAAANTWNQRCEAIATALVDATPLVSIVIVTHNNLPLTMLCLESLLRNTNLPAFEIVVVDNASTDGTPDFLGALAPGCPELRVVYNARNEGFPKANNQGLAASRGAFIVLLNNDTVVPPHWLPRLLAHLRDPAVGLVGPVTNFAGNEAKLPVSYRTIGQMEHFAAERSRLFEGQFADIPVLAMFCVAMRRETYDRVGALDERFGIGMFEDDDYTHRVRALGLRIVCARDVFIHHVGQAAFKTLIDRGDYDALFEQNRRWYETKWGVRWVPHRHGALNWKGGPSGRPPGSASLDTRAFDAPAQVP
ncbi:MAG: glycosyltransferase [Acidobacteria bacterium]|nr:glycosyltransferase [Acidobacteriota bacterium]